MVPALRYCSDDRDIPDHCRFKAIDACFDGLRRIYDRLLCARNVSARVTRSRSSIRDCRCFPPCEEITYDVTYSLSRWPADSFDGDEAYSDIFWTEQYDERFKGPQDTEKDELYGMHFDEANRGVSMRDFARLNVYIADSNVLQTEEQSEYTSTQLLADIGGQLGLWVGVSVITLAEVVELLVDVIYHLSRIYGPYSRGREFSRKRNDSVKTTTHCAACNSGACPAGSGSTSMAFEGKGEAEARDTMKLGF